MMRPIASTMIALALVASCATTEDVVFRPVDFGAIPNDDADDRVAIQAALDDAAAAPHGASVELGCGGWTITRAPIGSADRFAGLLLHGAGVSLAGSGPCTVLAMVGDAGHGEFRGIDVHEALDVTVRDLTVDSSSVVNTDEQTHAIQATGPVDVLRIERVSFAHPRHGADRSGDCLRLLGNPDELVNDVSVIDATFEVCARSGIGVQRGTFGLQVQASRFRGIGKTAVDVEPTSFGGNGAFVLVGNRFEDTAIPRPGGAAISIGGYDVPLAMASLVANVLEHRGISTYRVADLSMIGNAITCDPTDNTPCVDVLNIGTRWEIAGGSIHRRAGDGSPSLVGSVVRASQHSQSAATDRGMLHHVAITQDAPLYPVWVESASNLTIDHVDILYTTSSTTPASGVAGIGMRATTLPLDGIDLDANRIRAMTPGALLAAIAIAASPKSVGQVTVVNNQASGVDQGLRCTAAGGGVFAAPIVYLGNAWGALGHPVAYSCPAPLDRTGM